MSEKDLEKKIIELDSMLFRSHKREEALEKIVNDLAMITRMLMAKVQKTHPDSKVLKSAKAYLKKNDLEGSILRG